MAGPSVMPDRTPRSSTPPPALCSARPRGVLLDKTEKRLVFFFPVAPRWFLSPRAPPFRASVCHGHTRRGAPDSSHASLLADGKSSQGARGEVRTKRAVQEPICHGQNRMGRLHRERDFEVLRRKSSPMCCGCKYFLECGCTALLRKMHCIFCSASRLLSRLYLASQADDAPTGPVDIRSKMMPEKMGTGGAKSKGGGAPPLEHQFFFNFQNPVAAPNMPLLPPHCPPARPPPPPPPPCTPPLPRKRMGRTRPFWTW